MTWQDTQLSHVFDLPDSDNVPEAEASLEEDVTPDILRRGYFYEKIKFAWDPTDELILDRIEGAADQKFAELFGEAISEIDGFYGSLRVPKLRNGIAVLDTHGRQVWEIDGETGNPKESWDQLTGQDIEQTLMNLQRIKMTIAPAVNRLKNEAIFAKMVAGDSRDDTRVSTKSGLADDKAAKANKDSRVDRWHAFYRYVLWSTVDTFQKEMIDFTFRLKDVRYWRIQDQG